MQSSTYIYEAEIMTIDQLVKVDAFAA